VTEGSLFGGTECSAYGAAGLAVEAGGAGGNAAARLLWLTGLLTAPGAVGGTVGVAVK
jgi:hypothetical protein